MAQSHRKHTYYAQEGQKSKRLHEFPTQKKKYIKEALSMIVCLLIFRQNESF